MKFKSYLQEEFDQQSCLKDAKEWLAKKFPKEDFGFTFKHKPNLTNSTKTYSASINGKEFDILGRLMDSNSDGTKDTVLFKIEPVEEEPESENKEPSF